MFDRPLSALRAPRLWLTAAFACFAVSIVVGYHQDQIAADAVMAEKVPYPSVVPIQNFDPGLHSNILREVHLLAEADMSRIISLKVGSDAGTRTVEIVPVFPVTYMSAPLAASVLRGDAPRRPVGRSDAAALGRAINSVRTIERMPVGLIVSEGRTVDDLTEIGDGMNGPLVMFLGAEIGNGDVFVRAEQALASEGLRLLDDIPVVWLYPGGERPVIAVSDFSTLRDALFAAAITMALSSAALSLAASHRRRTEERMYALEEVAAVGEFPGKFVPMHRDQEERVRAEQDESERHAAQTRKVLSRAFGG